MGYLFNEADELDLINLVNKGNEDLTLIVKRFFKEHDLTLATCEHLFSTRTFYILFVTGFAEGFLKTHQEEIVKEDFSKWLLFEESKGCFPDTKRLETLLLRAVINAKEKENPPSLKKWVATIEEVYSLRDELVSKEVAAVQKEEG